MVVGGEGCVVEGGEWCVVVEDEGMWWWWGRVRGVCAYNLNKLTPSHTP